MKVVFLFRGELPQADANKYIPLWDKWFKELTDKGIFRGGIPIAPQGKLVTQNNVETLQLTDDLVTGYAELEFPSMDEAIATAKQCPNRLYGGKVEIREPMNMSR